MSGYWPVSLILHVLHLFVTSFLISCFSSDTSYFSISDFHASCELSLHFLATPKDMSVRLTIRKYQAFLFPS